MKTLLLVSALLILGCTSKTDEALTAVKSQLKDPDSAKFGDVFAGSESGSFCGTVNAKNSFGGYAGETKYFVVNNNAVLVREINPRSVEIQLDIMQRNPTHQLPKSLSDDCDLIERHAKICPAHKAESLILCEPIRKLQ